MKKKSGEKPLQIIVQKGELVEITDPAELADLERRRRESDKAIAAAEKAYDAALAKARKAAARKAR